MPERQPLGTTTTSASGGTAVLVAHHGDPAPPAGPIDVTPLQRGHQCDLDATVPAGTAPFLAAGSPVAWHYGRGTDAGWVVSDDERGLVAWIPTGAPRLAWSLATTGSIRDIPLDQRFTPRAWAWRQSAWRGAGVLRVAPTGKPWSLWWFDNPDGTHAGVYVNLELPHRREPGLPLTHTRDLTLDLWFDEDGCWWKDEDELEAQVAAGHGSSAEAELVRALGRQAQAELFDSPDWPMAAGFEDFVPPASLDVPPPLPDVPFVREGLAQL